MCVVWVLIALAMVSAVPINTPMETLNPISPEDIPDCGEKALSLKEWMNKTKRYDDSQFRQELHFNRGENDCGGERPKGDGVKFALQDCPPVGIPESMRACANRTGGDHLTFFMTWFLSEEHFTQRQWRSIESVFYHHPQATVTVVSNTLEPSLFDPLRSLGCGVVVEKVQPKVWAENTTLQNWTRQIDDYKHGAMFFDHLKDAVALLLMYTRGGVYFESDTIFTNSIYHLHNAIGEGTFENLAPISYANSSDVTPDATPVVTAPPVHLTTSVMIFEKGNTFVEAVMRGFGEWYEAEVAKETAGYGYAAWTATRTWNETFSMSRVAADFTVMSPQAFNLIPQNDVAKFFVSSRHELVDNDNEILLARTYAVRLWGDVTRNESVQEGSLVHRLLTEFCLMCDRPVQ